MFLTTFFRKSLAVLLALNISGAPATVQSVEDEPYDFAIAVIPDTQYYTGEKRGGKNEMFKAQTRWIAENAAKEKIAYVIHLGDITDDGEKVPQQWQNAVEAMAVLQQPRAGFPEGIPFGMAVGNHDQTKSQYPLSGSTASYNKYFGIDKFKKKSWYGGHYGQNNDSHYDLFTAGGMKFITIYFEYDSFDEDIENLNNWASALLEKYSDRKAILVSHSILHFNNTPGTNEKAFPKFSKQGQRIFDRMKRFPNVFMTLSGHVGDHGEGFRLDGYAGNIIKSYLSDYQSRPEGGHGLMRLMRFSRSRDLVSVRTFSPYTNEVEEDGDSKFSTPWFHHTHAARFLDADNDQITDLIAFSGGTWSISGREVRFGQEGDIAVPADYNGDGKVELAVFRPADGKFYWQNGTSFAIGKQDDIPLAGDFDGDGFADAAVYRPSTMTWHVAGLAPVKFGVKDAIPVPADYDGDGMTDMAFFNPKNSVWQLYGIGNIPLQTIHIAGDIPVPADYDGDGRVDMAVYRPGTGEWIIDKFPKPIKFGSAGDLPLPGNYAPGGKAGIGVLSNGQVKIFQGKTVKAPGKPLVNLPVALRMK